MISSLNLFTEPKKSGTSETLSFPHLLSGAFTPPHYFLEPFVSSPLYSRAYCPFLSARFLRFISQSVMFDPETLPYHNPKTVRRTALITAGNSGVGWHAVLHLYLHGYVVYVAGRSKLRGAASIAAAKQQAEEITASYTPEAQASRFTGELHYLELDLASLPSVRAAARALGNLEENLTILINNAGVLAPPYSVTGDGFEVQLQTLHVAPFLLTLSLLPLLERTLQVDTQPPRVIYVSSATHRLAMINVSPGRALHYRPNVVFSWLRYAVAETAGIHFIRMLALRNPRILCLLVDPGLVMQTNYFTSWTRLPIIGIVFWCLFQLIAFFFGVSANAAAYLLLQACLDTELRPENDSGAHFSRHIKAEPLRVARDMNLAARSWIWTTHQLAKRNYHTDPALRRE